jgi:fructokinase
MTKKIIAVGNAIVDILCKVDEKFLQDNNLIKGSMSLIDAETAAKLSNLLSEKTTSGGSAGNTVATLAQMGAKTAFIGKVGQDKFGQQFINEIEKSGVRFIGGNSYEKLSAKSFVLVTPDAQRTMCTFLGCASEIEENLIKEEHFKDAEFLYLEGYLWDRPETIAALRKAIDLAKTNGTKIAFSLSDGFCVSRHKKDFIELVSNKIDVLFANESEAVELTSSKDFSDKNLTEFFLNKSHLTTIITRSEKGCVVIKDQKIIEVATDKIEKIVDTTGAGDAFAAGFLQELVNNNSLEKCANLGNKLAGKIIQQFGARFENEEIKNI